MTEDLHELGELLVSTSAAVVRRVPGDGMELSLAAARVLARIRDNEPVRISDLAIQERSSQPTITNHIKRLEAAGLVQRELDASDARAWLITVTPLGSRATGRAAQPDGHQRRADAGQAHGPGPQDPAGRAGDHAAHHRHVLIRYHSVGCPGESPPVRHRDPRGP